MIFIGLSLLIIAAYGAQNAIVNIPSDVCQCSQISSQLDCTLANRCQWSFQSSSCESINCSKVSDQYSCALNSQCYWTGLACTELKHFNCGSIQLNAQNGLTSCQEANIFCAPDPKSATTCITRSSTTVNCASCTTSVECVKNGLACKWESATGGSGTCQPIGCPNLRTQEDCLYYATTTAYKSLQLCTWQNGNCIPATTAQVSKYSYNTCFLNTLGTYTFSSNNVDDQGNFKGYCMSCFDLLLSGLIVLGALII
ncbi:unnamed protein product (macronuclear) [Paramecium tetraurelia]|uniref:Mini antigen n=1 Tax=Paramecium tetraurelia TaxID=5888 RepID=A0CCI1_PARTE|nr:uncharacterized protein GSPATT00037283001 [Paramecium tetraurelia]CAK68498.1 unnamed protein product [Paramecium tetraurelia]|eukprot:XP_001435895.1 hypothetical protein (macronuclear) [Paramecium tetraurelia strain d4-2]